MTACADCNQRPAWSTWSGVDVCRDCLAARVRKGTERQETPAETLDALAQLTERIRAAFEAALEKFEGGKR